MRIKAKYAYKHFGIILSTSKPSLLTLDGFIERDYSLTSNELFWYLCLDDHYKLFEKNKILQYFIFVKEEYQSMINNNVKIGCREAYKLNYWCNYVINFFSNDCKRMQSQARRKAYNKYKKKHDCSFDTFVEQILPERLDFLFSFYDFSKSYYKPMYSLTWYEQKEKDLIENYKINMRHFDSLNSEEFNNEINDFVKDNAFEEILNLNEEKIENGGVYLLILDNYKQAYIGISNNIKKRIIQHFKKIVPYDRRIFGEVNKSKISIDSFGCLDITRIFVRSEKEYDTNIALCEEEYFIDSINNKFLTNRIDGGEMLLGPEELAVKTI